MGQKNMVNEISYPAAELKKAINLLDYVIEIAEIGDRIENQKTGKTGDGFYTHHLKEIREILATRYQPSLLK